MPRKRKTKLTQRTKPKQPDEESSHSLSEEEQNARLEAFLKDFDIEVAKRVKDMRSQMKNLCRIVHQAFNLDILRLPSHVRDTKRSELLGAKEVEEIKKDISSDIDQLLAKQLKTAPVKEEPLQNGPTVNKKGRQRKKTATTKKIKTTAGTRKKTIQDENHPPTTVTRATRMSTRASSARRKPLKTPANSSTLSQLGFDTPFMTPKFDPRLPVTPAMARQPKRGEVLMSHAGSPVISEEANGTNAVKNLSKETSMLQNLQMLDQKRMMEELEEATLDENTRKQVLSNLHIIMDRILKNTAND